AVFDAETEVYVDPSPPKPTLLFPRHGDTVSGLAAVFAAGGQGLQAQFDVRPAPFLTLRMPGPISLVQTNYRYDGTNGAYMCDPTSEAAVFLSDPDVLRILEGLPEC